MFKKIQHIHFVGIGGSGMSGIAEVLITLGYQVSGSDAKRSETTQHLQKLGARFFCGHKKKNITGADVVVTSTAIARDNPEVVSAHQQSIPVIPRIEMLAELARLKYTIAIAGTHGKTTTTSMAALVLERGGLDPTIVVGGRLKNIKSGAKLGRGEFLVAEADESDGSFLKLSPAITVVTNIDNDHLDYYGTLEAIKRAFVQHINRVPFYGCAIVCSDDAQVRSIIPEITRRYRTYGLTGNPDYKAGSIRRLAGGSSFTVYKRKQKLGVVRLGVPGIHNVLNALAAVAVGCELDIPFIKIMQGITEYAGVGRRLELKGEKRGIMVIDDYGHHPTEIKATLRAIRSAWAKRRLVVLFQPHRYTRTAHLYKDFAHAFGDADQVHLMAIYPAGEKPITGVSSQLIFNEMKRCKVPVEYFTNVEVLAQRLKPGDIVLTLGAGPVYKTGEELLQQI